MRFNERFGGIPTLTLQRRGIALPVLPDPWVGHPITWTHAGSTYFVGDVVSATPHFDPRVGWILTYQCLGLRNRLDWFPHTDSATGTSSTSFNLTLGDPSYNPAQALRSVGQILTAILTMPDNAAALNRIGIGGYTGLPLAHTLPADTLTDLALLTVIPPQPAYFGAEKFGETDRQGGRLTRTSGAPGLAVSRLFLTCFYDNGAPLWSRRLLDTRLEGRDNQPWTRSRPSRVGSRTIMARIPPLADDDASPHSRAALDAIRSAHGRVTNMKRTLAHSPVALGALMTWYDLREEVLPFLGERCTNLFAHAISAGTDCLICSTFFRRILIEAGDDPDKLHLDDREQALVDYGRQLARDPNAVSDELYARVAREFTPAQVVALTAFGALMVATNLFNNALKVDLDDYLMAYRKEPRR